MIEQIQTAPPPFDALSSFDTVVADTKAGTSHTGSAHSLAPAKEDDTVTLSSSAEATQLYLQGNSVSQIAALLGLPTATVDTDLNITQATSATVQAVTGSASLSLPSTTATATSAPYTAPSISEAQTS